MKKIKFDVILQLSIFMINLKYTRKGRLSMSYKCCDALLHKLAINPDNINFCCSPYDNKLQYLNNYNGELIDIEDYKKRRAYYHEMFKSGNIPEPCRNCSYVEDKEWDDQIGFKFISISSRTKCSCNCYYCVQSKGNPDVKNWLNTREAWDVKPVIKALYDDNLILKDCVYIIGGGEPTEFPEGELEYLAYIGLLTESQIVFLSNAIIYSDSIAKTISVASCELKVSVDAGTKETFEKIKGVKAFDLVWTNLEKYSNAVKNNPKGRVQIKYIIIPGVNDSMNEIESFIKRCFKVGCKHIEIAIEYDWYGENKDKPISDELKTAIKYFKSLQSKGVFFGDAHDWFEEQLRK